MQPLNEYQAAEEVDMENTTTSFAESQHVPAHDSKQPDDNSNKTMRDMERETIIKALRVNNNNRKVAAAELGISERTLYRKIREYNLQSTNTHKNTI